MIEKNTGFNKVKYAPFLVAITYLCLTVILFFCGPFDWPIDNSEVLVFFVFLCFSALFLGYFFGVHVPQSQGELYSWRFFFRAGAIVSIVLLFPSTYVYAGRWPWEIYSVIGNQGLAYSEMLAALSANESGFRMYVALVRSLLAPFIFCVIPFGILNWSKLSKFDVLLFLLTISSIFLFSFMRGTDRETGNLFFLVISTVFLVLCRKVELNGRLTFKVSRLVLATLFFLCFVLLTLHLFVDRKESRMGGVDAFCVAEGVVCSDGKQNVDGVLLKIIFGVDMLSAYLSQGYYGLSLALKEDFTSTFGFGHSSFVTEAFGKLVDSSVYERSYLYKVSKHGWDDKAQWSTIFPWIASDVSFPVVPLVICFFGFVWGAAWKDAVRGKNDVAVLVYLYMCLLVVYIPANNQIAQSFDSYFSFFVWFLLWLILRARKNKSR